MWIKYEKLIKFLFILVVFSALLGLSSCTTVDSSKTTPPWGKTLETDNKQNYEKLLFSVTDGLAKGDYNLFTKNFTPELKKRFSKSNFDISIVTFNKKYGKLESIKFLDSLTVGKLKLLLWKSRFSKNKDDVLINLVVGKIEGEDKIFGWSIT